MVNDKDEVEGRATTMWMHEKSGRRPTATFAKFYVM